jgi:hypothetical protein
MIKLKIVKRPDTDAIHRKLIAAVAREYAGIGRDEKARLEEPVTDWQVGPSIYYKISVNMTRWRLSMYHRSRTTGGQRYNWVRLGTRPHVIRPVRATRLRFRVPHAPRTLAPTQRMPSGQVRTVYANVANHPGIRPRNRTRGFPRYEYEKYYANISRADSFYKRTARAGRVALRAIR